jgi:hypothetical protein
MMHYLAIYDALLEKTVALKAKAISYTEKQKSGLIDKELHENKI